MNSVDHMISDEICRYNGSAMVTVELTKVSSRPTTTCQQFSTLHFVMLDINTVGIEQLRVMSQGVWLE